MQIVGPYGFKQFGEFHQADANTHESLGKVERIDRYIGGAIESRVETIPVRTGPFEKQT